MLAVAGATAALCALIGAAWPVSSATRDSFTPSDTAAAAPALATGGRLPLSSQACAPALLHRSCRCASPGPESGIAAAAENGGGRRAGGGAGAGRDGDAPRRPRDRHRRVAGGGTRPAGAPFRRTPCLPGRPPV